MKTQILRLEPYDDVVSIRDKMAWAKTQRILLVWPARRLRLRRLDLLLIQRRAAELGVWVALVTHDRAIRTEADELGLPVFESIEQAHRAHWHTRRRRVLRQRRRLHTIEELLSLRRESLPTAPEWTRHPYVRAGFFTLAVFALLAIAAVLLPSAEVYLMPETRSTGLTLTVQAGPGIRQVNLTGAVPAEWRTIEVEGRAEIPVSGETLAPASAAHGTVVFTNLTDHSVSIPQGTVVSDSESGVQFVTTRNALLPASVGAQVHVPVEAVDWGPQGNLPAGRLRSVSGVLGLQVAVDNPEPTTGGREVAVSAPAPLDRSRLYSQLRAELQSTALDELRSTLDAGDVLIEDSLEPVEVVERRYDPPDDRPADRLALTLRMTFHALVVRGADLQALAEAVQQARLQPGYRAEAGSLRWAVVTSPQVEGDMVRWKAYIGWREVAEIAEEGVLSGIRGKSVLAAAMWLRETAPLAAPPRFTLSPPWWPQLPLLPFRITLLIGPFGP